MSLTYQLEPLVRTEMCWQAKRYKWSITAKKKKKKKRKSSGNF